MVPHRRRTRCDSLVAATAVASKPAWPRTSPGVADQIISSPQPLSRVREFGVELRPRRRIFTAIGTQRARRRGRADRPTATTSLRGRESRSSSPTGAQHATPSRPLHRPLHIANDFGLHDSRYRRRIRCFASGRDTFCPVGGCRHDWDFTGKRMLSWLVNRSQDGRPDEMAWDMHYLVAISPIDHLGAGDIILSGTPAVSRPVQPGDVARRRRLGTLTSRVEGPTP